MAKYKYSIIPGEGNGEDSLPTFVVSRENKEKVQELVFSYDSPEKRDAALETVYNLLTYWSNN